jgi:CBS domain-containing protein
MKVKEVMKKAIAIDSDISLKKASEVMAQEDSNCIVLLKNGKISGIITEGDIIRNSKNLNKSISAIIKEPIIIDQEEEIETARQILTKNKIKRAPVIGTEEKLVGIIEIGDIKDNKEEEFFLE